jgi:hypothetical protein
MHQDKAFSRSGAVAQRGTSSRPLTCLSSLPLSVFRRSSVGGQLYPRETTLELSCLEHTCSNMERACRAVAGIAEAGMTREQIRAISIWSFDGMNPSADGRVRRMGTRMIQQILLSCPIPPPCPPIASAKADAPLRPRLLPNRQREGGQVSASSIPILQKSPHKA